MYNEKEKARIIGSVVYLFFFMLMVIVVLFTSALLPTLKITFYSASRELTMEELFSGEDFQCRGAFWAYIAGAIMMVLGHLGFGGLGWGLHKLLLSKNVVTSSEEGQEKMAPYEVFLYVLYGAAFVGGAVLISQVPNIFASTYSEYSNYVGLGAGPIVAISLSSICAAVVFFITLCGVDVGIVARKRTKANK